MYGPAIKKLEVPQKKSHNTSIENKIMTATQIIEELEYAISINGGEDVEVRLAHQPKWPFEYSIDEAVTIAVDDEEVGDQKEKIVYLSEGAQLGYLNEDAARELGW
jgi:hypothetical protein